MSEQLLHGLEVVDQGARRTAGFNGQRDTQAFGCRQHLAEDLDGPIEEPLLISVGVLPSPGGDHDGSPQVGRHLDGPFQKPGIGGALRRIAGAEVGVGIEGGNGDTGLFRPLAHPVARGGPVLGAEVRGGDRNEGRRNFQADVNGRIAVLAQHVHGLFDRQVTQQVGVAADSLHIRPTIRRASSGEAMSLPISLAMRTAFSTSSALVLA